MEGNEYFQMIVRNSVLFIVDKEHCGKKWYIKLELAKTLRG